MVTKGAAKVVHAGALGGGLEQLGALILQPDGRQVRAEEAG
ncbi:MAG: hypothetical protein ABW217_10355 [Polyangiaceae bacterium]